MTAQTPTTTAPAVADKPVKEKTVTINGSITETQNETIEDYRWKNRLSRSDVLRLAVDAFIDKLKTSDAAQSVTDTKVSPKV